jgi:ABC-2 type transport system permease protein
VTGAAFEMELRLRWRLVAIAAAALIGVVVGVGALFPTLGHTIGKLSLPKGVADLLGGANYSTLSGWLKSEIVSIYGPLVLVGVAITSAAASTAGEEQERILALLLAHPVSRHRLLLAKAAGVAVSVAALGVATWVGLLIAVAVAGGGINAGDLAAQSLHLVFLALVFGALALALGAASGDRALASGGAAGVAVLMFLINGFAPALHAISWLRYLSAFYYYSGHDPLRRGIDPGDLGVLAAAIAVLLALAVVGLRRRDLRA